MINTYETIYLVWGRDNLGGIEILEGCCKSLEAADELVKGICEERVGFGDDKVENFLVTCADLWDVGK